MAKRLLIIEDNERRIALFERWCPKGVRVVVAREGGTALGLVRRDNESGTYIGICLDHDLDLQAHGQPIKGQVVVDHMVMHWQDRPPVLVHSMNPSGAAKMMRLLDGNGFPVTRIPMASLTAKKFRAWVDECLEDAEP